MDETKRKYIINNLENNPTKSDVPQAALKTTIDNLGKIIDSMEGKLINMYYYHSTLDKNNHSEPVDSISLGKDNKIVYPSDWNPNSCTCAACALGWATFHPELPILPSMFRRFSDSRKKYLHMYLYSEHYLPAIPVNSFTWSYLFTESSSAQKDTYESVKKRIEEVIEIYTEYSDEHYPTQDEKDLQL